MSVELDGMLGQQSGLASITEIAVFPVLRWSSFPWKNTLQTDLRVGPIGVSYTSSISPLVRGKEGKGSQTLSFLVVVLADSSPDKPSEAFFARTHQRGTINDVFNAYGTNGEDFFAIGYRHRFWLARTL